MKSELTIKQARFVRALALGGNATQAVIDAGYRVKKRRTAKQMSYQLLAKPHVRASLKEVLDEMYPQLKAEAGRWLVAALEAPIAGTPEANEGASMTWTEKLRFLEFYARLSEEEKGASPFPTPSSGARFIPELPRS